MRFADVPVASVESCEAVLVGVLERFKRNTLAHHAGMGPDNPSLTENEKKDKRREVVSRGISLSVLEQILLLCDDQPHVIGLFTEVADAVTKLVLSDEKKMFDALASGEESDGLNTALVVLGGFLMLEAIRSHKESQAKDN